MRASPNRGPSVQHPMTSKLSAVAPAPVPADTPAEPPPATETAVQPVPAAPADEPSVRVLKKYPNRRLYDTQASSYITLADVKQMVLARQDFVVRDAKTGEDLTRSILLQIILEEEAGGVPMLSSPMLAQMIRFYGHAMQGLMGSYLEKNIEAFTEVQARLGDSAKSLTPELWTQLMNGQTPAMQRLMTDYMEQSRTLFQKMQEQMADSAETLFPRLPGFLPPKR